MEEFVKFAISKGVRKYGFSSHAPLPFTTFWNMNIDDFDDYQNEFKRLKLKYASEIELFIALEIDYINDFIDIKNNLYNTENLDYLIGSIHYMDKLPNGNFWTVDGNFEDFKNGLNQLFDGDIKAAAKRFYEITNIMVQKGGFEMVGHFDKIALNGSKCRGFKTTQSWYQNLVGDALQQIKNNDLILEINTKSLTDKGMTYPDLNFYPLINELKIPIVVNSDCHYPTKITEGFEQTFSALKKAGHKTMHQLIDGKWQAVDFDENGLLF
jgi:histidinol-phosphatase (PHP family)